MVKQCMWRACADVKLKLSDGAKNFILEEGTDTKYGARHLKRAIEHLLLQPLANLKATHQIRDGDVVSVHFNPIDTQLVFVLEARRDMILKMPTPIT